ncbi:putative D-amino acid oxidase [Pestalotiopsis sp. NC0098]|nr:putative D-amino acid oxidase [Pestalotiopsis sp. NC0098]
MAARNEPKRIGILGAGIVGLSCALRLVDAGYNVTIVARDLPGDASQDWASPWAGALLAPYPGGDHQMQEKSLSFYKRHLGVQGTGISELKITEYYDDRDTDESIWYKHLFPDFAWMPKSSLPPHANIGFSYTGLSVDPTFLLPWIVQRLRRSQVEFKRCTVKALGEVRRLTDAELIVNASGLGAGCLARDGLVEPIRGQTMFVSIPPERSSLYDQAVIFQGSEYTYAIPRRCSGGVILGGVSQHGSEDRSVQAGLRSDIHQRVNIISNQAFAWLDVEAPNAAIKDIVGFRPGRKGGLRVEREENTIHAYGAGGLGYVYAFGIAERVADLVKDISPKL